MGRHTQEESEDTCKQQEEEVPDYNSGNTLKFRFRYREVLISHVGFVYC